MPSSSDIPHDYNDPYADLVADIAAQFSKATGTSWFLGRRYGATAFLPDGKVRTSYPVELREKFPDGVIAQRSIPGVGFWDFGTAEGTEFKHRYSLNGPDGSKVRQCDVYRVIVGLNSTTIHNYRASGGK